MAEPLIPDELRAAYEKLIGDGSRLLPADTSSEAHATAAALSDAGLAMIAGRVPRLLLPTDPKVAFARLLARWHQMIVETRERLNQAGAYAIKYQRVELHAAARRAETTCALISSHEHAIALHYALAFSTRNLLREWSTGPYGASRTLPTGEPHPAEYFYFAPRLKERGATQVMLYDAAFLKDDGGLDDMTAGYRDGEEIRVSQEKLPMKLLIVDTDTALVPLRPYGYPCLLIHDEALVNALTKFFELKWEQAEPWAPPGVPIPEKENTQRRHVLECLAAGLKDEAIARQQGVSVRTVRRHIATLMEELGVTTRFAAGVAAVRRGWISRAA